MRASHQLLNSRARVTRRYALLPLEGVPLSKLPDWDGCDARVLAAPAIGAEFAQYLIDIPAGGRRRNAADAHGAQTFGYLLSGMIGVEIRGMQNVTLDPGGFFYVPANHEYSIKSRDAARLLLVRKRYEPLPPAQRDAPGPIIDHESNFPASAFLGNEHARLQKLLPDDLSFDMEMNIFTFDPGHCLPYVETHVMEHGLCFLQGKGLYFLDDDWMEVEATDFIWMGPFCPQCFYATGPTPAKYIYYKNVNREIPL